MNDLAESTMPGGLFINGELNKGFQFKPIDGALEAMITEIVNNCRHLPSGVTRILHCALDNIVGAPSTQALVRELSVGDRHYLLKTLAGHIDDKPVWLSVKCGACGDLMDVSFRYADLPTKKAQKDFPCTVINTSVGKIHARVPRGYEQEALANVGDGINDAQAQDYLLKHVLIKKDDGGPIDVSALSQRDKSVIEKTLEEISPEVANMIMTRCPSCQRENKIPINLYGFMNASDSHLMHEIHIIARHYHWSEKAILSLPRKRRKKYLALIERE